MSCPISRCCLTAMYRRMNTIANEASKTSVGRWVFSLSGSVERGATAGLVVEALERAAPKRPERDLANDEIALLIRWLTGRSEETIILVASLNLFDRLPRQDQLFCPSHILWRVPCISSPNGRCCPGPSGSSEPCPRWRDRR